MPLAEAVQSYIDNVLRHRRDEATLIDPPTGTFTAPTEIVAAEDDDDDWRNNV